MQKHTRAWNFALFGLTVVLLFYWRPQACSSYLENWLGLAPAQFVLTGLAINGAWWLMPSHPSINHPVLQVNTLHTCNSGPHCLLDCVDPVHALLLLLLLLLRVALLST